MMYRMRRDLENVIVDELGSMANEDTRWTPEEVRADAENFGMDPNDFIERYLEEAPSKGGLNMIKMGTQFWDESNSRFLTVDAVGADPNCYSCIQEEIEDGSELVMTGRVWMCRGELEQMEVI